MALIAQQAAPVNGVSITFTAVNASDTFVPNDRGVLIYRTNGTSTNLTFVVPGNNSYGQAIPDPVVAMGATANFAVWAGGYAAAADATTQLVTVTASGALTSVTVAYLIF